MHQTFNVKMTSHERLEMRAKINFCADLGKAPTEMLTLLHKTKGNMSVSRTIVFKCTVSFKLAVKTLKTMSDRAVKQSFTHPLQHQLKRH